MSGEVVFPEKPRGVAVKTELERAIELMVTGEHVIVRCRCGDKTAWHKEDPAEHAMCQRCMHY